MFISFLQIIKKKMQEKKQNLPTILLKVSKYQVLFS